MDHRARSDAELLALARQGWASALGAMLHRHGSAVVEVVRGARDPERAVLDTFTDAMRTLGAAPDDDLATWLRGLATGHAPSDAAADPAAADTVPDPDLDAIWARLASRWPHGRARLHVPPPLAWTLAVLATIALGAGLPWLTLGPLDDEPELPQLRAFPIDDEREPGEPTEEDGEEAADEPLPTYEFPIPPAQVDDPAEDADPEDPDAPPTEEPDAPDAEGPDATPPDPDDADEPDDPEDPDAPPTEEPT